MKYPFSPEVLDALPEELAELFRALEVQLLEEICSRLKIAGELNEVAVEAIKALRAHGIDLEDIEKAIADATGISREKLDKLLDDVVERNQAYYTDLIDKAKVTQPDTLLDAEFIANIKAQTLDELTNITRSMGFLVQQGGKSVMMGPAKAYQWALDNAVVEINAGATSYNEAIKRAVTKLADSGIKTVSYESGHVDHVDVAVRRAVMTGVSQLSAKYVENSAEWLETPYFEVSAHSGARDKGVGPMNHKSWQGQVYSVNDGDIYPNIYAVCGLDTGPGLEGWNCRHRRYPFVEGVMERTYTDEQLRNIDPPPFKYQGKTYTAYEATQMQRKMERTVRQLTRREKAYKAAGLTEDARNMAARRRRLSKEYTDFSKAAGLPEQRERMKVRYVDDKSIRSAEKALLIRKTPADIKSDVVRLRETLNVETALVNGVLPKGATMEKVRIIAGKSSETPLRVAHYLSENYGGDPLQWVKKGGIIKTDNFQYDVHWFEIEGKHYEEKLKGVKKIRK